MDKKLLSRLLLLISGLSGVFGLTFISKLNELNDTQSFALDANPGTKHSGNHYIAKEPTCVDIGYKEVYVSCLTHEAFFPGEDDEIISEGIWTETGLDVSSGIGGAPDSAIIPATGEHSFVGTIVPPDSPARGYTVYECEHCDAEEIGDFDFSQYSGLRFDETSRLLANHGFYNNDFTIELSFNLSKDLSDNTRGGVIFGNYGLADQEGVLNIEITTFGHPRIYMQDSDAVYDCVFTSFDARSSDVVNMAITISGTSASLFSDGELIETKTLGSTVPMLGKTMLVGNDYRGGGTQYFKGTIYTFSIFDDIRSSEEMVQDIVLADGEDENCCLTYNFISWQDWSNYFPDEYDPSAPSYITASNAAELQEYAGLGVKNIELTQSFEIDRTIFVLGDIRIYSETDVTLTRASDFASDLFVVGENSEGRNKALDNVECVLTLEQPDGATLTIDGNKDNLTVEPDGSALYASYSGVVNVGSGVVVQNNIKLSNYRFLEFTGKTSHLAGGAAALITYGSTLNIRGGSFINNECHIIDSETVDGITTTFQSAYGGAIYGGGSVNMYDGVIQSNRAMRGAGFYLASLSHLYAGTITGNSTTRNGAGIYLSNDDATQCYLGSKDGSVDLIIKDNTASTSGAGVYGTSFPSLTVLGHTVFENNVSSTYGGAIYFGGAMSISGATFSGNRANNYYGGAMYITFTKGDDTTALARNTVTIEDSIFSDNYSKAGGAICTFGSRVDIFGCSFTRNGSTSESTTSSGGALYACNNDDETYSVSSSLINLSNVEFASNKAVNGGAIYGAVNSVFNFNSVTFSGNEATTNGGAINIHGATITATSGITSFERNVAAGNGGALYISYTTLDANLNTGVDSSVNIKNVTFLENQATLGGAIYGTVKTAQANILTSANSLFTGNTSSSDGGAVFLGAATATFSNSSFVNNVATNNGGAIGFNNSTARITGGNFQNNQASNGGAIYSSNATVTIDGNAVFDSNASTSSGGALYVSGGSEITITSARFGGNTSVSGGVFYVNRSTVNIKPSENDDVLFGPLSNGADGNSGSNGGVFYATVGGIVNIEGGTFKNNSASKGGVFYGNTVTAGSASINISGGVFENNVASASGGVAYMNGGEIHIIGDSAFCNNNAVSGGVIYQSGGMAELGGNTVFTENTATNGGVIYAANDANVLISGGTFDSNSSTSHGSVGYCSDHSVVTITAIRAGGNTSDGSGGVFYVHSSTLTIDESDSGSVFFGPLTQGSSGNSTGVSGSVIYASTSAIVDIHGGTFDGNSAATNGGAITAANTSSVTISNAIFSNNTAKGGGAISVAGDATVSLNSCTFNSNSATYSKTDNGGGGGAIYLSGTQDVTILDCAFNGNTSVKFGGAIDINGDITVTLSGGSFTGNSAASGGAIYVYSPGAVLNISGTEFSENTATGSGGAIYLNQGTVNTTNSCSFTSNSATTHAGAIYVLDGSLNVTNSTFDSNVAENNGGALYLYNSSATVLTDATFVNNTATSGNGGAIYIASSASLSFNNVTGIGNKCTNGYGGFVGATTSCSLRLNGLTLSGNKAKTAANGNNFRINNANVVVVVVGSNSNLNITDGNNALSESDVFKGASGFGVSYEE